MRIQMLTPNLIAVAIFLATNATLSISPVLGQSQSIYGSIVGVVTDPTGAVGPGVTVTATHINTNIASSMVTDDQGYYRIENLLPGPYRVAAELPE